MSFYTLYASANKYSNKQLTAYSTSFLIVSLLLAAKLYCDLTLGETCSGGGNFAQGGNPRVPPLHSLSHFVTTPYGNISCCLQSGLHCIHFIKESDLATEKHTLSSSHTFTGLFSFSS